MDNVVVRSATWRTVALAVYVGVNAWLFIVLPPFAQDWTVLWVHLPAALDAGELYRMPTALPYVWSPVIAPLMALIVQVGYWPYFALHLAALAFLRDWRPIALALASWALWVDAFGANTVTFVFVSGALALRGSRPASIVYLALLLLMPRPVQLPLAAWLLWQDRSLWRPFALMFAVHAAAVVASGYAGEWIGIMRSYGSAAGYNLGPTLLFGAWWLVVGLPLAAWLTLKGRVGWAGLALSPYVLPQYLLMPLAELGRLRQRPQLDVAEVNLGAVTHQV